MTQSGEIRPGVHRIDSVLDDRIVSLYLFVGLQRSLLFDAGVAGAIPGYVMPYLERVGIPLHSVEHVVISHCDVDHFGGIGDATEAFPSARILAHAEDAPAIEDFEVLLRDRGREFAPRFGLDVEPSAVDWMRAVIHPGRVDDRIRSEQSIDLGGRSIRILHTPGHSKGHLSIYDSENGLLAISDAILGDAVPTAKGAPAFPPTYRDERDYLLTIERARALAPRYLATAHYGVFVGDGVARFLDLSRDFALELRREVLDTLRQAGREVTLVELLTILNARIGRWPKEGAEGALAFPVVGSLEQLLLEGHARIRDSAGGALISFVAG